MSEVYQFTVNGVPRTTEADKPLLRYLRDDLHLHSVKDGCSEGVHPDDPEGSRENDPDGGRPDGL